MDNNSWKTIDNTKGIPEPILTNVKNAAEGWGIPEKDRVLFYDGAQFGYNIAQVFVEDLKEDVEKLSARCKELEEQINH